MVKNKLITTPIEEEKRERLNQYCAAAGITVSQLITKYIDKVLDGTLEDSPSSAHKTSTEIFNIHARLESMDVIIQNLQRFVNYQQFQQSLDKPLDKPLDVSLPLEQPLDKPLEVNSQLDVSLPLEQSLDKSLEVNSQLDVSLPLEQSLDKSLEVNSQLDVSLPLEQPLDKPLEVNSQLDVSLPLEQSLDKSLERYTLEDTAQYLKDKNNYNRICTIKSDRISQSTMASHLNRYQYPHPKSKTWDRNEVRKVCNIWGIVTA